jgi:hypothetical protein
MSRQIFFVTCRQSENREIHMKKVKRFLIWLIVLSIPIGLVGYQNRAFLLEKREIGLNLYFDTYQTPDLSIALFFLILFFAGLLISYFGSLSEKYVARKNIRRLSDEIDTDKKKISELEARLASAQAAQAKSDSRLSSSTADVPEL